MKTYTVHVGYCSQYDPDRIEEVLLRSLETVRLERPLTGRIVIKPNLVMAHPAIAREGYTRPEVVEAVLRLVGSRGRSVRSTDIVEKSGLGVTTASMFRWAGYRDLARRYPVRLRPMEEGRKSVVVLENGKVHRHVTVARQMAERDFLVFVPKLKTNVLSHGYSGALKLNIGTVDGRERIAHHHRDLPVKIVDLLEAANPDLIVTDGIRMAFGGNQMTQGGGDAGVLIVSTNAVAHDMVCARLLNLDPFRIPHIREAMDRGYGPTSFGRIRITGDAPVRKVQAVTRKYHSGFMPVEKFPCPFRIVSGEPLCIGGCQGIFLDWLHMVRDRKPGLLKRFPRLTVVIGKTEKRIEDQRVLLVGSCAAASKNIRSKRIVRIKGCPPTHKRIVWDMMTRYFLLAPLVRPSLIIDGFVLYPLKKLKGWLVNL
jgi:uncharacterized protein (DUF362 family)